MTVLATGAVAFGVLAIGALHVTVALLTAVVMLAAAVGALILGSRLGAPAKICLAASAFTVVQAVPMPIDWVRFLSPEGAEVWERAAHLVAPGSSVRGSLSLSPSASWFEVLKYAVYAAAFVAGRFVGRQHGAEFCVAGIFVTGVLVALVTIAHGVLGISRVYGLYTPVFAGHGWPIGPLLNSNNLAGYMNLTAFAGLGLMFSRRESSLPKPVIGLAVAVVVGCLFVSASRGGVAAFVAGGLVFSGSLLLRQKERRRAVGKLLIAAGVAAGGGMLATLAWSERMTADLTSMDVPKIALWRWTLALARDFPWVGVGRGAFEGAIGPYRTIPGHVTFAYAENFPLQVVCDWGIPFGAALLLAAGCALRPKRFLHSTATTGAYAGFIALAVQNLADLSFELMGITCSVAFLLGGCREERDEAETSRRARARAASAFGLGSVVVFSLALSLAKNPVVERQRLYAEFGQALADRSTGVEGRMRELLRNAVLNAPGSPYGFQLGATAALRFGFDALPWIARALSRDPLDPRSHLVAARALAGRGATSQAFLHLRLAVEYEPSLVGTVARLALSFDQTLPVLDRAVPSGASGTRLLIAMADLAPRELREALLRRAGERDPDAMEPHRLLALDLIEALEAHSPRCADDRAPQCKSDVARLANLLQRRAPKQAEWLRLRARVLILEQNWIDADALLATNCDVVEPRIECLELRLATSLRVASSKVHQNVVNDLRQTCVGADGCARAELVISDTYLRMGWQREALLPKRRAAELLPTVGNWMAVAELAAAVSNRIEAERALRRVQELGADPTVAARVREMRERLAARPSGE